MSKCVDLTGKRFGKLTVIKRAEDYISPSGFHSTMWECKCDCGNICKAFATELKNGKKKDCGCERRNNLSKSHINDLTGKRFGKLTVISYAYTKNKNANWLCRCDCGNEKIMQSSSIKKAKGCGKCTEYKFEDLSGRKYGKLTVLRRSDRTGKYVYFDCICDCGNEVTVRATDLKDGTTKSCGCIKKEKYKSGGYNLKHGCWKHPAYGAYSKMKDRCYNPNVESYKNYGARGITICDEWLGQKGPINFCEWADNNGYKKGLEIDRIDNNKGYSPANCRWVDRFVQANNKRNNRWIDGFGETKTIGEWSRIMDIDYDMIYRRLKKGKSIEEIAEEFNKKL